MLLLFDTFESDEEYRNQCLFSLRQMKKMIENTSRQEKIQEQLTEAKDVFVDVIEEI